MDPTLESDVTTAVTAEKAELARQIADDVIDANTKTSSKLVSLPIAKLAEAWGNVRSAMDAQEPTADLFVTGAIILFAQGKPEEALAYFAKAFDRETPSARAYVARGLTYKTLQQLTQARADFTEASMHTLRVLNTDFYRDAAKRQLDIWSGKATEASEVSSAQGG